MSFALPLTRTRGRRIKPRDERTFDGRALNRSVVRRFAVRTTVGLPTASFERSPR